MLSIPQRKAIRRRLAEVEAARRARERALTTRIYKSLVSHVRKFQPLLGRFL